tara:strand:+ start:1648 stop:2040 length:393 start_codon:yes stop_codon:yes gene_type:complete
MKNINLLQKSLKEYDNDLVSHLEYAREFNRWANGVDVPQNAEELNELGNFSEDGDCEILQEYAKEDGVTDMDVIENSCRLHYLLKFLWLKDLAEEMRINGDISKKEATIFTKKIKENIVDRIINNYIYER